MKQWLLTISVNTRYRVIFACLYWKSPGISCGLESGHPVNAKSAWSFSLSAVAFLCAHNTSIVCQVFCAIFRRPVNALVILSNYNKLKFVILQPSVQGYDSDLAYKKWTFAHRCTGQFFLGGGLCHLCPKNFRQHPKNCWTNLQNYFARHTPPSNY